MSKQQELDKLAAKIVADKVCPELAAGATQLVMGDGSAEAEVVFIGEAPGKDEDIQGKPFVGAAGKFLNTMIESLGWKRSDVYITNIVKYRPPDNRDPQPEEVEAFMPYLFKQLAIIAPKLTVTLGRYAMNVFMPTLRISQVHGEPKRLGIRNWKLESSNSAGRQAASAMSGSGKHCSEVYEQYSEREAQPLTQQRTASKSGVSGSATEQALASLVILPLYHPAAALYNGGMRETLLEDFAKIPATLKLIKNDIN